MKITVVIPSLNEQPRIADAIESARVAAADEVIVADGGSRDETCSIARDHDCPVVESRAGRGIQLNAGARQATGDVLLFLHADCRLTSSCCDQIRSQFRTPFVFGAFRQSIQASGLRYRFLEWGNTARVRWRKMPYGDQAIFVNRASFDAVGQFPEIRLMEDVALGDRLKQIHRPLLLPGPVQVSPRRWQECGVLKQTWRNWKLFAKYRCGADPDRLADEYSKTTTPQNKT